MSVNALGAQSRVATAQQKEPHAGIASVRGIRFIYGRPVTAQAASDTFGVVTPAISVAYCPRGLHALGGGWNSADTTSDPVTISSNEAGKGTNRWLVIAEDMSTSNTPSGFTFQATAVCG